MLQGYVRDFSARTVLQFRSGSDYISYEVVIDTGFEGELALPAGLVNRLAPETSLERRTVMPADGTLREVPFTYVELVWHGVNRMTEVLITEGNPLLGMVLLQGSLLQIEAIDGGEVSIESIA